MIKCICSILLLCTLSACSIKQEIQPFTSQISDKICIIEDKKVRSGFLTTFRNTLEKLGYQVIILQEGSATSDCEMVSTYMGKWSWDLAIYLSYATIQVYKDGKLVGDVVYDSRNAGLNTGKFVDGEEKIAELVKLLFPPASQGNKP